MTDPLARFREWQEAAVAAGVTLPEAVTLATADEAGRPSARTVLLKGVDERGFVIMKPGDMMVFYTDGICEALGREGDSGPFEEYGMERLLKVARQNLGRPARDVVDAVFASVDAWTGGADPEDDRTLMVVNYPLLDANVTQAFPRPMGLI